MTSVAVRAALRLPEFRTRTVTTVYRARWRLRYRRGVVCHYSVAARGCWRCSRSVNATRWGSVASVGTMSGGRTGQAFAAESRGVSTAGDAVVMFYRSHGRVRR